MATPEPWPLPSCSDPDPEIVEALEGNNGRACMPDLGAASNGDVLAALDKALAALNSDAVDEATYDLLSVTFDEDKGEVIEVAAAAERRRTSARSPVCGGERRSGAVYVVKWNGDRGPASYACGTPDQALDKADELSARGFKEVRIIDPKGKEWTGQDLERSL